MAWAQVALAGGFALAGGTLQHFFGLSNAKRAEKQARRAEEHAAFVDFAKAGRRLQRAMSEHREARSIVGPTGSSPATQLAERINDLAEAIAVARLVVADDDLVQELETFETRARRLCREGLRADGDSLELTPMLRRIREYELSTTLRRTGRRLRTERRTQP